ncbi:MAG: flavin reductase family protein [Actinobacteria bacterium]|nr:flavin reductase family protein [Actinomycetota bacterium]
MAVDADSFRRALRRFASGVTVVTVGLDGELHGMTASSFASVSLEPPLILVCLDKASRTRALILEKGSFAVNILADDQEDVSRSFSRRGVKPFDQLSHRPGTGGDPLLAGAIAWIECRLDQMVEAGDHDIFVGEVLSCNDHAGTPLLYYDQSYRSLTDPSA